MKVARTLSFTETRVEEEDVPSLAAGDALVRVEACGLCGSDATPWYVEKKAPTVLGHEPAGVVVETAEGCALEVGQRVFFHHHVSCGECHYCARGFETCCALFKSSRLYPGGFSELVRVPEENVVKDTYVLPDGVDFDAATFIEPLACSLRAVDKLRIQAGDSVLIIGLGAMGLMNSALCKERGAALVIGSELNPGRREPEACWGVDLALDPTAGDFKQRVEEATSGRGPDHVIVGPSSESAILQACEIVAHGGTVCLFSPVSPEQKVVLPLNRFYFGEITLVSSYSCAAKETLEALDLIERDVVPVAKLISHRLTLDEVGEGIIKTQQAGADWTRAVVYPQR
ncbi:MAG: alcohol dehydrogenase catalytic domain-containing protein [Planctomycetes bacterium]|nr:alcohol dehydrogenase catalytic domain-containing protein [Planctomycetota bacterium]